MRIRTKIVVVVTVTVSLVLAAFGTIVYFQVVNSNLARLDSRLESQAEKLSAELEENSLEHDFPNIPSLLEIKTEGLPSTPFRILDSTGAPLYEDSLLHDEAIHGWNEVVARKSVWETVRRSGRSFRSYWMPVELEDQFRYELQVVVSLDDLNSSASLLRLSLLLVVPLFILLSAAAIYALVTFSLRPVTRMIEIADRTSASDLTGRVPLGNTRDEVHTLGTALNRMMERIDSAFRAQKQFVADASHEIRTPLTIIQSESEYARRRVRDAASRKSLRIILSEVDHLRTLSEDLLLIAKLDSNQTRLRKERLDLNRIVRECVDSMNAFAGQRSVSVSVQKSPHVETGADRETIRRVVLNLLDNAIRHSGPGTRVRVSVRSVQGSGVITVEDNGKGIPPDELPHIFDRFQRGALARATHTGHGLGLAIARKIAELHGGTILVQSAEGHGTIFTVSLPLIVQPVS